MSDVLEIKFLGQVYRFKAEDTDIDVIDVAEYVEEKLAKVEREYAGLPPGKIMVMAALHMGKDYIAIKNELETLKKEIEKQSKLIGEKIMLMQS